MSRRRRSMSSSGPMQIAAHRRLRPDHVLHGVDEFLGQPPVRDDHEPDHARVPQRRSFPQSPGARWPPRSECARARLIPPLSPAPRCSSARRELGRPRPRTRQRQSTGWRRPQNRACTPRRRGAAAARRSAGAADDAGRSRASGRRSRPRTPTPRISIRPAAVAGARPKSRPPETNTTARSSATRRKPASSGAQGQVALAGAGGPSIRAPSQRPRTRRATRPAWQDHGSVHASGQGDAEARARRRLPRSIAVLGPDAAAMGLDDLAGDGQAQAGVAAERRALGPGGVEALEHGLQVLRRHARARRRRPWRPPRRLRPPSRRRLTRTSPPGGLNERALSMRLRNTWPSGPSRPVTRMGSLAAGLDRSGHATSPGLARGLVEGRRCRAAAAPGRAASGDSARQLGVQPRGVGDVGDQPVEAADVLLQDAAAGGRAARAVLDQLQRLHRRADRGHRIAELVGHVGGEALDRLHALGQGRGSCPPASG